MVDAVGDFFFYELICISVHGEQLCEHSKNLGQSCGSDMLIGAPPQGQKFFKKKNHISPPALLSTAADDDYFLLVFTFLERIVMETYVYIQKGKIKKI